MLLCAMMVHGVQLSREKSLRWFVVLLVLLVVGCWVDGGGIRPDQPREGGARQRPQHRRAKHKSIQ